jgi:hypothetical protein
VPTGWSTGTTEQVERARTHILRVESNTSDVYSKNPAARAFWSFLYTLDSLSNFGLNITEIMYIRKWQRKVGCIKLMSLMGGQLKNCYEIVFIKKIMKIVSHQILI